MPSVVGEGVHQSLALASARGFGKDFVPAPMQAKQEVTGAIIMPR